MYNTIIVGVDGHRHDRDAAELARRLAAPGARVVLVTVVPGDADAHGAPTARLAEGGAELLHAAAERVAMLDAPREVVAAPSVAAGLHDLAMRENADVIVVGSCARTGLHRVLAGDDTRAVGRDAPCAVAVAPDGYAHAPGVRLLRIGIGFDAGPESLAAVAAARALAASDAHSVLSARCVLQSSARAIDPIGGSVASLYEEDRKAAEVQLAALEDIRGEVRFGPAPEMLVEFGEDLDLLVVGSRHHGAMGRVFLGSTAEALTRQSPCPLLIVPRAPQPAAV